MNSLQIEIKQGKLENCYQLALIVPEFSNERIPYKEFQQRLDNRKNIILTAYLDGQLAGFKIGYEKDEAGVFYSWLGGVLPKFRRKGIAKALANKQEQLVQTLGFKILEFKTRNYLKPMLIFGLTNGFHIVEIEKRANPVENRIILRKSLAFRAQNDNDSHLNP